MLSFSNPFKFPRFFGASNRTAITLKPVEIHDVETQQEKRARTLKHLLKLNHTKFSIIYHQLRFHNHMPHILGSAYILGSQSEHLQNIYEEEAKELEPWEDSPGEISTFDWRDYLGKHEYQRAYVDFFEDRLVSHGYDWKKVVEEYLFGGKEPLVNCLIAGVGHPLIHLGYAYELSSREVAMEALGLATTSYNFLHKYLDDPSYSKPSTYTSSSPMEILQKVYEDKRFDNLIDNQGAESIGSLFENHEEALLEHWNAWQIPNLMSQFKESQHAATALLVATHEPGGNQSYDFFLVHLLTTSHAVRILLPIIPGEFQLGLVRQWWLLTLAVYVAQLRPKIVLENITKYDVGDRDWSWVTKQALEGKWALDAHFVKALRAMKVAAETWGDGDHYYLKAVCRFTEFDGWGGFGPMESGIKRGSATGLGL